LFEYVTNAEISYRVKGEVYDVSEEVLRQLDELESNGDWYVRKEISVIMNDALMTVQAYINNEKAVKLPHGDFNQYITEETRKFYTNFIS
jgi:gamma-glutamylcyclotransferase (GGCT)/AIG2-like uncharacterized protein YtfP